VSVGFSFSSIKAFLSFSSDLIRAFPIPTGGFGRPEQIAAAVAFLLSPEASFCCGSVLFVDGGSDALLRPNAY
jgi:NAD(P)-dependent dehydrogenase (short-subunit alcohol dehydrogenase family)